MSSDTTLRIVQEVFDDLARGDMEAVRGHCHPDVVTSLAGANALSGRYDGIDATFEMLARAFELSDGTFAVHPYRFFEDGSGQVVVAMETSATRHGQTASLHEAGVFTVEDDKIRSMAFLFEDLGANDRFWAAT